MTPKNRSQNLGPNILVCEDDARFRRLLLKILHGSASGLDIGDVVDVDSGEAACEVAAKRPIDLVLLDLELPGIDGIEVVRRIKRQQPAIEILILTSFADEERVFEAMRAGAAGYLVKGGAPARLCSAIREVLDGGTVIEARLARRFWNLFAAARGRVPQRYGLTAEEIEVLALVARGLSNPEAARALGASRRSIKAHLESIYRKLDVASRVEATVKAVQSELIEL